MSSNVAIDYLSFSVDLANVVDELFDGLSVVADALRDMLGDEIFKHVFITTEGWKGASGQRPYRFGNCNHNVGVFVWFGGHSNALVQFSGSGCKYLERYDMLQDVLERVETRITRLDIAIDVKTPTSPLEFVSAGYSDRIKTYGEQRSPSGDTCYIGSRKSQKFCRVYRYAHPHPRSGLLRIEYETKKAQAQIAARSILDNGLSHAADALTKYYQWKHEDTPMHNDMVEKMQSEVSNRSDAKTLHWLLKQCAPAFKRLVANGTIEDPMSLLEKHFLPSEDNESWEVDNA